MFKITLQSCEIKSVNHFEKGINYVRSIICCIQKTVHHFFFPINQSFSKSYNSSNFSLIFRNKKRSTERDL